ncbi:MAG: hypothetical protein R2849_10720 [Thermomicrobiales bacterium]
MDRVELGDVPGKNDIVLIPAVVGPENDSAFIDQIAGDAATLERGGLYAFFNTQPSADMLIMAGQS